MNKTPEWVLRILVVVVVIGGLVAAGILVPIRPTPEQTVAFVENTVTVPDGLIPSSSQSLTTYSMHGPTVLYLYPMRQGQVVVWTVTHEFSNGVNDNSVEEFAIEYVTGHFFREPTRRYAPLVWSNPNSLTLRYTQFEGRTAAGGVIPLPDVKSVVITWDNASETQTQVYDSMYLVVREDDLRPVWAVGMDADGNVIEDTMHYVDGS